MDEVPAEKDFIVSGDLSGITLMCPHCSFDVYPGDGSRYMQQLLKVIEDHLNVCSGYGRWRLA